MIEDGDIDPPEPTPPPAAAPPPPEKEKNSSGGLLVCMIVYITLEHLIYHFTCLEILIICIVF